MGSFTAGSFDAELKRAGSFVSTALDNYVFGGLIEIRRGLPRGARGASGARAQAAVRARRGVRIFADPHRHRHQLHTPVSPTSFASASTPTTAGYGHVSRCTSGGLSTRTPQARRRLGMGIGTSLKIRVRGSGRPGERKAQKRCYEGGIQVPHTWAISACTSTKYPSTVRWFTTCTRISADNTVCWNCAWISVLGQVNHPLLFCAACEDWKHQKRRDSCARSTSTGTSQRLLAADGNLLLQRIPYRARCRVRELNGWNVVVRLLECIK
ncbi:hypothetical protein DFH09DRAFT_1068525 [Mycena vulgaris]|nr:hypothetical protein DFH09DRAFT_1068525 [Mycena vulgaris]